MNRKMSCQTAPHDVPTGHRLVELFWRLGPAFMRWAEAHMDQPGLTPQRVRLLAILLEEGPATMGVLGDKMGVTATNITALVDALEKDGMAVRRPHPADRRAIMVEITPKAEKQMTENCAVFKDRVATLFSDMSAEEQDQLCALLGKVRDALTDRDILVSCDKCA